MRFLLILLGLVVVFPVLAEAQGQAVFDLAKDHIDINAGFHGDNLEVYGEKEKNEEIVVVARGPNVSMRVRRKEQVFGSWVKKQSVLFEGIPSFYAVASSKPLAEAADILALEEHQIGAQYLAFKALSKTIKDQSSDVFTKALIRNREGELLMLDRPAEVEFLGNNLFKASFYLPHNVPVGAYVVSAYYFRDGALVNKIDRPLRVVQVGLISALKDFALEHRFLYGMACVFLAIFAGWLSNKLRNSF